MNWRLISVEQQTHNKYLNHFVLHYEVDTELGQSRPYDYFLCSRRSIDQLRAKCRDFSRADGVILGLYRVDEVTKEVSILLTKQFRPALGKYVTSFSAGLLDPGDEDEFEAARREALEEVGCEIDDIEVLSPAAPTSTGLSDEMCAFLLARVTKIASNHLEEFEDINSRFVSLNELKAMLNDKETFFPLNIRLVCHILLSRFPCQD